MRQSTVKRQTGNKYEMEKRGSQIYGNIAPSPSLSIDQKHQLIQFIDKCKHQTQVSRLSELASILVGYVCSP